VTAPAAEAGNKQKVGEEVDTMNPTALVARKGLPPQDGKEGVDHGVAGKSSRRCPPLRYPCPETSLTAISERSGEPKGRIVAKKNLGGRRGFLLPLAQISEIMEKRTVVRGPTKYPSKDVQGWAAA